MSDIKEEKKPTKSTAEKKTAESTSADDRTTKAKKPASKKSEKPSTKAPAKSSAKSKAKGDEKSDAKAEPKASAKAAAKVDVTKKEEKPKKKTSAKKTKEEKPPVEDKDGYLIFQQFAFGTLASLATGVTIVKGFSESPKVVAQQKLVALILGVFILAPILILAAIRGMFLEVGGWVILPICCIGPILYLRDFINRVFRKSSGQSILKKR